VSVNWPTGAIDARMSPYMLQAQQKWTVVPVADAGGYPGSPYFRITIAGTDRALTATADRELAVRPTFTGAPEQLWRIDQLTDGTYRLMPKATAGAQAPLALSAVGSSMPTLTTFNPNSDRQRWILKVP
jgi:arabinan endo-1,5-alpha-L-arabinosidase